MSETYQLVYGGGPGRGFAVSQDYVLPKMAIAEAKALSLPRSYGKEVVVVQKIDGRAVEYGRARGGKFYATGPVKNSSTETGKRANDYADTLPAGMRAKFWNRYERLILQGTAPPRAFVVARDEIDEELAAKPNPLPLMDRSRHIDTGFYRVTDKEAGALAREAGKSLPKHGYQLRVELPYGRMAWLQRTPVSSTRDFRAPARGWVWAIFGIEKL